MRTRAAVLWPGEPGWSVEAIVLDAPAPGEVLVRLTATGLCHSDHHLIDGGYPGSRRPVIGARAVVAVDPVPFKRDIAVKLGAAAAVPGLADAVEVVRDMTEGRMANKTIMAMAVGDGRFLESALTLVGRRGRVVVVNVHPAEENVATVNLHSLQSLEKQVVGCLAGAWDGRKGIGFLTDLYLRGRYDLETIVTRSYDSLAELPFGYRDQAAGTVVRGVVRLSGG